MPAELALLKVPQEGRSLCNQCATKVLGYLSRCSELPEEGAVRVTLPTWQLAALQVPAVISKQVQVGERQEKKKAYAGGNFRPGLARSN